MARAVASWLLPSIALLYGYFMAGIPSRLDPHEAPKARLGLVPVYPTESLARAGGIDIIFVHGLGSNPDTTWQAKRPPATAEFREETGTNREGFVDWVSEFLPNDLPAATRKGVRMFYYNYDSYWMRDAVDTRLANLGDELLEHIRQIRVSDTERSRDLAFVAHSYGGLVVKQALVRAQASRDLSYIGDQTKTILFLGTPHRGSSFSIWGWLAAHALWPLGSNFLILANLEYDSASLLDLHREFVGTTRDNWRVYNFFEQRPTRIFGLWLIRWQQLCVREPSATYEGPNIRNIGVPVDHSGLNKFGSRSDAYHAILSKLIEVTGSLADSQQHRPGRDIPQPSPGPHFLVPFPENKRFMGREGILRRLKDGLFDDRCTRSKAIVGLGGVGKTQVALQIAYHAKTHSSRSVVWLPALSMAAFEQSCAEMVERLRLSTPGTEDAKKVVKRYLESSASGSWLVVVDNADDLATLMDPGGIYTYLPKHGDGCILFTTRAMDVAQAVADDVDDVEELKEMSEIEAKGFFKQLLPGFQADDEAVTELLRKLTFLPLAISQAAAYIRRNKTLVSKYLSLLRDVDKEAISLLRREFPDRTRYDESRHAVASTWLISFEQIQKHDETAARLLSFMSQIEPRAVPESMLPRTETEESLLHAIGTLCGYAFLYRREDGEMLDMHSLVHLAAQEWVRGRGNAEGVKRDVILHMATVFQSNDWENREAWRKYLPHVLRSIRVNKEGERWEEEECQLGYWAGRCLQVEGRIAEAVELLQHVDKVRKTTLAENHPDRLSSQHALAAAYRANGQVKEAVELLQHVVKVRKATLAENHPCRLASQYELAIAHQANGEAKEAAELLEHVVKVQKMTSAENHLNRLRSQHELATAYQANGRVKEAVELLEHVVEMHKTSSAENHPDRLASQHELAGAYRAKGHVMEAVELLEHVVQVHKTALTENHPDLLTSQHTLAGAYQANGQVKEAVELLQHVVKVQKMTLAKDHPSQLASQHALAVAYYANNEIKEAVELLKHVVKVQNTTLAENHPDRLASQHTLAVVYQAKGQVKEAVELLEHVVEVHKTSSAENHPDRLASQYELARAYRANGYVKEAVELLEYVVEVYKTSLAENHPSQIASQLELAGAYRANGQGKEAVKLLKHVVEVHKMTLTENHLHRLASQHGLAVVYLENGQVKEAVELLEHVVKVHKTTLTQNHPSRLASQYALAVAYQANGQAKED